MSKFRNLMLAAVAAVALPVSAQALTVTYSDDVVQNGMNVTYTQLDAGRATVKFDWTGSTGQTPAAGYLDFTVTGSGLEIGISQISGYNYFSLDQGSSFTRLTTALTACDTATNIAAIRGTCNVVDNTLASQVRSPLGETLLGDESYRIGVFAGWKQNSSVTFTLTAVPVPASGVLLAGVLAGLAWRARRKAA